MTWAGVVARKRPVASNVPLNRVERRCRRKQRKSLRIATHDHVAAARRGANECSLIEPGLGGVCSTRTGPGACKCETEFGHGSGYGPREIVDGAAQRDRLRRGGGRRSRISRRRIAHGRGCEGYGTGGRISSEIDAKVERADPRLLPRNVTKETALRSARTKSANSPAVPPKVPK